MCVRVLARGGASSCRPTAWRACVSRRRRATPPSATPSAKSSSTIRCSRSRASKPTLNRIVPSFTLIESLQSSGTVGVGTRLARRRRRLTWNTAAAAGAGDPMENRGDGATGGEHARHVRDAHLPADHYDHRASQRARRGHGAHQSASHQGVPSKAPSPAPSQAQSAAASAQRTLVVLFEHDAESHGWALDVFMLTGAFSCVSV